MFRRAPNRLRVLIAAALLVGSVQASAAAPTVVRQFPFDTPLGLSPRFSHDGDPSKAEPRPLTIGFGSGAARAPGAPAGTFYTVSDRGPGLSCAHSGRAPIGLRDFCGGDPHVEILPAPFFDPSIYHFRLIGSGDALRLQLIGVIPLHNAAGLPVTGLSNELPRLPVDLRRPTAGRRSDLAPAIAPDGRRLPFDQDALDPEAIAALPTGGFWLGEENGPSLVRVGAHGGVLERVVPDDAGRRIEGHAASVCDALRRGTATTAPAAYPVRCVLPGILALRKPNHGIEGIALSNDGRTLYFALQSPLADPSIADADRSRNVRLFRVALKADGAFARVTGEYLLRLDRPARYPDDHGAGQRSVRISELSMTRSGTLVALERIDRDARLYRIDLSRASNLLGTRWDRLRSQPSLEELTDPAQAGIRPVRTRLLLATAELKPKLPAKLEGMAFLGAHRLLLVNDDDFSVRGAGTVFSLLRLPNAKPR